LRQHHGVQLILLHHPEVLGARRRASKDTAEELRS
jgi:hypothetical protein